MRINKYIAQSGIASRRKADELIEAGRVKVNGETITMLGFEIRRKDKVTVDGKVVSCKNFEYFRFYKAILRQHRTRKAERQYMTCFPIPCGS